MPFAPHEATEKHREICRAWHDHFLRITIRDLDRELAWRVATNQPMEWIPIHYTQTTIMEKEEWLELLAGLYREAGWNVLIRLDQGNVHFKITEDLERGVSGN